jgi:hypothetical protein
MRIRILTCLVVGLAWATAGHAATILSQPLDPSQFGTNSELPGQQRADDFELAVATTVEGVSWAGHYGDPTPLADPVSFTIRFFEDDGGSPGVPVTNAVAEIAVQVAAVPTGADYDGAPWFAYSFDSLSLALDAGKYWVSILESDARTAPSGGSEWFWGISAAASLASAFRAADGGAWSITGSNLALGITGTPIPEPAAGLLVLLGAASVATTLAARRQRADRDVRT